MSVAQLNINNNLQNNYREIIEGLDLKAKSELMILLAKEIADSALKTKSKKEKDIVFELAGSWKDKRTAEEIISDIYSSRTKNERILECFDD